MRRYDHQIHREIKARRRALFHDGRSPKGLWVAERLSLRRAFMFAAKITKGGKLKKALIGTINGIAEIVIGIVWVALLVGAVVLVVKIIDWLILA